MNFGRLILSWSLVALLAFVISSSAGLGLWWAVSVVVVAMLLNLVIAEIEDRMPGGFFLPLEKDR